MAPSKRNILWIIPIVIIGVFFWIYGPQNDITDNEYIAYVKKSTLNENSTMPLGQLMNQTCKKPYWKFFESQGGQKVVEFEGDCTVNSKKESVNIQFKVNEDKTNLKVGGMLLNGVEVKKEAKKSFINVLTAKQ